MKETHRTTSLTHGYTPTRMESTGEATAAQGRAIAQPLHKPGPQPLNVHHGSMDLHTRSTTASGAVLGATHSGVDALSAHYTIRKAFKTG